MKRSLLVNLFVISGMAFAAGNNTYKVGLYQDSVIEGKTLKAGEYKISIENGNAVFKGRGKEAVTVPAHVENEPKKNPNTEVTYRDNNNVEVIRVAGTHAKIVFDNDTAPTQTGQ